MTDLKIAIQPISSMTKRMEVGMFTKVKAAFIMAGLAALAGIAGFVSELD